MHVEKLPKYTCERYYLLSEIEQRAVFVFLDEDNEADPDLPDSLDVIYLLWNSETEDVDAIKDKLDMIQVRYPNCLQKRTLVAIECFIPSDEYFHSNGKSNVATLLSWFNQYYPSSLCFIGVADSVSGTSALEKCHDFIEFLLAAAPLSEEYTRLIGYTRQEMLGHDPSREPDASSGVTQYLCSAPLEQVENWESKYKQVLIDSYSSRVSRKKEARDRVTSEAGRSGRSAIRNFLLVVPLVAVLIVVLVFVGRHSGFILV
mmetsp:Transcript_31130/g.52561  ORF Transcript_31130/g.52561 Transcript_31130/m.52561 type:complete len:260 (-) Transcript_31130:79-858(-)